MTDVKALAQEWVNANKYYKSEPIVLGTLSPTRAVAVEPTATEAFIAGFKLAQSLQEFPIFQHVLPNVQKNRK